MRIGYFLSCEEYTPAQLLEQARMAEQAGFESLWISDHYHPWNDEQGQSAFVWSMLGALAQACSLPVTTAVTCPSYRIHPAVVAQAAATSSVLHGGRFILGVGSGEALNEHILGQRWPTADERLAALEEAIEVMRDLWSGEFVTRNGPNYTVENARLYTLPDQPVPVYISGFGPKAAALAGRIGDGFVTTGPEAELIQTFRDNGGEGKPMQAGYKVCWSQDKSRAVETAHKIWANEQLPGELAQILPSPRHFEQASQLVTPDMVAESMPCGDDVAAHVEAFRPYAEAGFDDIHISQIGGGRAGTEAEGFFQFYSEKVLPELRSLSK